MTAATIATFDARIEVHRVALSRLLAERVDPMDLPRSMSQREVNDYQLKTVQLVQQQSEFEAVASQWAALPSDAADSTWMEHLTSFRQTLCDELLTIKSPIRERSIKERSDQLVWSIRFVDFCWRIAPPTMPIVDVSHMPIGKLMHDAGFGTMGEALRGPNGWQGSIRELEKRTKELANQRAAIRKMLDRLLVTPEERVHAEAESLAFHATLATMELRVNSTGNGLVSFTKDGESTATTSSLVMTCGKPHVGSTSHPVGSPLPRRVKIRRGFFLP